VTRRNAAFRGGIVANLRGSLRAHSADAAMSFIVIIWGLHFIVMKEGLSDVEPNTYNAIRFVAGLPIMLAVAYTQRAAMRLSWRDAALVIGITIIGPFGYQIGFASGLDRTTSTNTALLVATTPAWTALLSLFAGMVIVRRRLLAGIAITLAGVGLVVLGGAGADVALSEDDLIGSALVLGAAIVGAVGNILSKPVLDRLGGMPVAIWTYIATTIGMILLAAPDLATLSSSDVPARALPNVLYSGLLSSAGGFLAWNYALKVLGPTRASTYHNFPPIIAAVAGILILSDPLTVGLALGGPLTLAGVIIVRQNTLLRQRE